ncbi:MAG: hypothetical protein QOG68_1101 [Solirubrobacteraceae bacterium]|nr:hypothetical protein [Solirubrobacteraceae bacterium]
MQSIQRRPVLAAGLICLGLTAALLAALGLSRGIAFWSTSDGVYALTSREILDGLGLYRDVAAAQPPPVYLAGAALLGLDDSLTMLRAGLELAVLATSLLVYVAVVRLTGRRGLAVLAGVLAPLAPLTLHENALLTPETLAAPLLLGTALLAARPHREAAAGVLAALALSTKLSFALPALAILLAGPGRLRALAWCAGAVAVLAAAGAALYGGDLWRSVLVAQAQSGTTALTNLPGLLAQEAWNELPLVVLAAPAVLWRARARDPVLLRTVAAGAVGCLLLGLTVIKLGTYVNAVAPAEPALVVLGACGVAWVLDRSWRWRAVAVAGLALAAAQSGSLLLSPADPRPFTRPFAASGPRRALSAGQVEAYARAARACPADAPYPGVPFIAFVAHRRPLGDQPDLFIITVAENERFAERAARDLPQACPAGAPVVDPRGNVTSPPPA